MTDATEVNLYCCMAPECEKVYTSKFNLKRHVEIAHFKIKRFECEVCHGLYSSMQNLKEHINLHYGIKPFQCQECGDSYRQASQLSLHKRSHVRERKVEACFFANAPKSDDGDPEETKTGRPKRQAARHRRSFFSE